MHTIPTAILERFDHKVPNYIASSLWEVDFERLYDAGIRHLALDIDNTLVSFGERQLHSRVGEVLDRARQAGLIQSLSLATNSRRDISHIVNALQPDHTFQPRGLIMKPLPAYYERVLERLGADAPSVVMIGDKLIQDVWGARKVGMSAVLVKPVGRDFWLDRMFAIRLREKRLLRTYLPHHPEHWF
jgi:uncharacterized protein